VAPVLLLLHAVNESSVEYAQRRARLADRPLCHGCGRKRPKFDTSRFAEISRHSEPATFEDVGGQDHGLWRGISDISCETPGSRRRVSAR
jgi:hypothetical protein